MSPGGAKLQLPRKVAARHQVALFVTFHLQLELI